LVKTFNSFNNIIKKTSSVLDAVAGAILFLIMILMVVNVIFRTIFNMPFKGVYDLVSIGFVVMICLSFAYCAYNNGHVFVDFILEKFSIKTQKVVMIITNILSFLLFILMSFNMAKYGYSVFLFGETSLTIMVPLYPFIYLIAFGLFLLSLVSLRNILKILFIGDLQ